MIKDNARFYISKIEVCPTVFMEFFELALKNLNAEEKRAMRS